jgi:hypothetical protein
MTKQLQYYERAVPVSSKRHGSWSLETRSDYEYADHSNSVPLAAAEFAAAAADYAIVFVGEEGAVRPVVLLGLNSDENLYVDEQGNWNAKYIPAFVRRYPFVFSKSEDGKKFTLCIDEKHGGWNQESRGRPLFDSDGEGTEFLDKMFRFVTEYQRQFDATLAFCRKLQELDLLEPMTARFNLPSGDKAQLTGFMAIDRDKLKALPGDKLAELANTGELELMYLHLQSMRNIGSMLARLGHEGAGQTQGDEADSVADKSLH